MLLFSLAAALICAAAAGVVLWRAAHAAAGTVPPADEAVYARHVADLDALKASGLLDEEGWRSARAEAGRRLLKAAAKTLTFGGDGDAARDRALVAAIAVGAVIVAGGVYLVVGKPGRPDEPYAARLAEWSKHPERLDADQMAAVLEDALKKHPNDPVLMGYLGRAYGGSGHFVQAAALFEKLLKIRPGDARAWVALGEMRMAQAEGRVTPEAHAAFDQALKLDPDAAEALWWLGRDDILAGRKDAGLARWKTALAGLRPDDARRADLMGAINAVETGRFGQDPTRAQQAQAQAQAVAEAEPQDQAEMIRGMVQRLAERLQHERGQPADWARLVRAYTVLGDVAARDRALARARSLFAGKPEDLASIEAAARPAPAAP